MKSNICSLQEINPEETITEMKTEVDQPCIVKRGILSLEDRVCESISTYVQESVQKVRKSAFKGCGYDRITSLLKRNKSRNKELSFRFVLAAKSTKALGNKINSKGKKTLKIKAKKNSKREFTYKQSAQELKSFSTLSNFQRLSKCLSSSSSRFEEIESNLCGLLKSKIIKEISIPALNNNMKKRKYSDSDSTVSTCPSSPSNSQNAFKNIKKAHDTD